MIQARVVFISGNGDVLKGSWTCEKTMGDLIDYVAVMFDQVGLIMIPTDDAVICLPPGAYNSGVFRFEERTSE